MEKRRTRRLNVFFKIALSSGSVSYAGFIGNISEKGAYIRVRSADARIIFTPGTIYDLRLDSSPEEMPDLRCRVIWSYEIPLANQPGKSAYNLGVEIIEPSQEYKDIYSNTAMKNLDDQINSISG
ncbi:MAG: PilZ domain-containing protein [Nitrospirae bacterium]|nr:PilZ domain-containing protein [Nitrospirota bacterium]